MIVHAVVKEQEVREDQDGRIITISTLEVIDGLKNAKTGDLVELFQVGGELNGRVQKVSHQQSYNLHEEMVLFGVKLGEMIVSYGPGLGKFKVLRDQKNFEIKILEDLKDIIGVNRDLNGRFEIKKPTPRIFNGLIKFKKNIKKDIRNLGGIL